jgi:hypothetical protein
MVEKSILYFEGPGPRCTRQVVEAVTRCVADGGPKHVVIASVSGRTALRFARSLPREKLNVVCVSGPPSWQLYREYQGVCPVPEVKQRLEALGVVVVDGMISLVDGIDYGCARYGLVPPSWLIMETLVAVGGYGLKTAVEVTVMATEAGAVMATEAGAVPPFEEVLAVAGTDKGADTAAVVVSTFAHRFFSPQPERRFQLKEIIAMPRNKTWWETIGLGDWQVAEREKRRTR